VDTLHKGDTEDDDDADDDDNNNNNKLFFIFFVCFSNKYAYPDTHICKATTNIPN